MWQFKDNMFFGCFAHFPWCIQNAYVPNTSKSIGISAKTIVLNEHMAIYEIENKIKQCYNVVV